MADLKKMYTTILGDHFPMDMKITFGDQTLVYRKRTWAIPQDDGTVDERGIRYGENPDQVCRIPVTGPVEDECATEGGNPVHPVGLVIGIGQ